MMRLPLFILSLCFVLNVQAQNSFADRVMKSAKEVFLKNMNLIPLRHIF